MKYLCSCKISLGSYQARFFKCKSSAWLAKMQAWGQHYNIRTPFRQQNVENALGLVPEIDQYSRNLFLNYSARAIIAGALMVLLQRCIVICRWHLIMRSVTIKNNLQISTCKLSKFKISLKDAECELWLNIMANERNNDMMLVEK